MRNSGAWARGTPVGNAEPPHWEAGAQPCQSFCTTAGVAHTCAHAHLQPRTRAWAGLPRGTVQLCIPPPRGPFPPSSPWESPTHPAQLLRAVSGFPGAQAALAAPLHMGQTSAASPPGPPLFSLSLFTALLGHQHWRHRVAQRLAGAGRDRHSVTFLGCINSGCWDEQTGTNLPGKVPSVQ